MAEPPESLIQQLAATAVAVVWSMPDGGLRSELEGQPAGLLPGSFYPLHEGHIGLREAAARFLGSTVYYELSIRNVDKSPLDDTEIQIRRQQFIEHQPLALSNAPSFREKARLFHPTTFVVGVDTAQRVVQPQYYAGHRPDEALLEIQELGCRFLVASRVLQDQFMSLGDLEIPRGFRTLFQQLPVEAFRRDISSTDLRDS